MPRAPILFAAAVAVAMSWSVAAHAKSYGAKICDAPEYTCHKVKKGETWEKLFPNEEQRLTARKINRMNIKLRTGMTIAIPKEFGDSFMDHAPFPYRTAASGDKFIYVSLPDLAFAAYDENGKLKYWGPVSGGKNYCSDVGRGCRTPQGDFAIYTKRGAGCKSSKFPIGRGGAPMPYCMFFKGGYAMHGSYTVPGYNDSHGCVRLFIDDAKWLNTIFTNGESRIPVIIRR